MTRVVTLLLLVACGGKAPPPAPPPAPAPGPIDSSPTKIANAVPDDDEDQTGITMVNQRGHMEMDAIQAGIAPHTGELSDCYTSRVGRRRWLGGHVGIHWDIRADGEIIGVQIAESDLGAWPVEKCLLDVARAATFAKPVGGDADFSMPLDFTAKGRSAAWDEDKSVRAVGGQLAALDSCAAADGAPKKPAHAPNKRGHRNAKPDPASVPPMPDDVVVTVYVGPHGHAQSVGFASSKSQISDAWADCAEKTAMAWRLPDPRGEVAKLAVRYRPQ
jgi:hypothetical protein